MSEIKRARDARTEDILPGRHRPILRGMAADLEEAIRDLERRFPGCGVTLFVFNMPGRDERGCERFINYISSADRADMLAVLRAFVAHGDHGKVDRIADASPTSGPQ